MSPMQYVPRPCAGGCGTIIETPWPTCLAPECKAIYRANYNNGYRRERYEALVLSGCCGKCGMKIPKNAMSQTTGKPLTSRCAICAREARERQQKVRDKKATAKRKAAAIAKIAETTIRRNKANRIRVDAGLAPSRSSKPVIPKGLVKIEEI